MKKNKKKAPRNFMVLAMTLRVRSQKFKDKRAQRGGARNKQKEYLEE